MELSISNYASVHLEWTLAEQASERLFSQHCPYAPLDRGRPRPLKGNNPR